MKMSDNLHVIMRHMALTVVKELTGSSFELFAIYRKRNVMHYDVAKNYYRK